MKTIRASEIGAFIYCQRAWWYQKQGYPSENQRELERGSQYHSDHARSARQAIHIRRLAYLLLLVGLIVLVLGLTSFLFS